LTSVKEDDLSFALLERIEEKVGQLAEKLKQPPPVPVENEKTENKSSAATKKQLDTHHLCLLLGAYLEEHAPEIKKTTELEILCKIYKAKLALLSGNAEAAKGLIKGSQKLLKAALADPNLFPPALAKSIQSQYLALIRSVKAEQV